MNHASDGTASHGGSQEPKTQATENTRSVFRKLPKSSPTRQMRERILEAFLGCQDSRAVAKAFGVPTRVVDDIVKYATWRKLVQLEQRSESQRRPLVRAAGA